MTSRLSARAGSGAACLFLVYVAGLVAVTNLIFSADVTATTRVPGGVAHTGAYGITFAAAPVLAAPAAPVVTAPAITAPLALGSIPARAVVEVAAAPTLPGHAQASPAPGSSLESTSHRRGEVPLGGRPRQAAEKA